MFWTPEIGDSRSRNRRFQISEPAIPDRRFASGVPDGSSGISSVVWSILDGQAIGWSRNGRGHPIGQHTSVKSEMREKNKLLMCPLALIRHLDAKVAIALPPGNDYDVFSERVRKKLNLAGISGIYHAETNIPVQDLSELQDIDDLVVVENLAVAEAGSSATAAGRPDQLSAAFVCDTDRHMLANTRAVESVLDEELGGEDEEGKKKYERRGNPVYRALQRVAPMGW
eukprot:gene673-1127_t